MALKYPTTTAEESPNAILRRRLDLSVIHRPVYTIPGVPTNFRRELDLDIVRIATGGTYDDPGRMIGDDGAVSLRIVERGPVPEAARYAFNLARKTGKRVTSSSKYTIQKATDGLFERVARRSPASSPRCRTPIELFDALLGKVIMTPEKFQIVLVLNEYGDFLSDMACGLAGSLGIGASANLGFDAGGASCGSPSSTPPTAPPPTSPARTWPTRPRSSWPSRSCCTSSARSPSARPSRTPRSTSCARACEPATWVATIDRELHRGRRRRAFSTARARSARTQKDRRLPRLRRLSEWSEVSSEGSGYPPGFGFGFVNIAVRHRLRGLPFYPGNLDAELTVLGSAQPVALSGHLVAPDFSSGGARRGDPQPGPHRYVRASEI